MKTIREIGTVRKLQLEKVGRAATRSPNAEGRAHDSSDHERLLQVVEAVADLVAMVDSTGHLTYVNQSGRALIGIGDAETVSHLRLPDLHSPKQWKDLEYVALPAAVREGTWIGETTLLTRSGREIPVSEMLIVRKSSRGRVENVTVVMRDVRNRKRSEERLHHSEARFRTLVETMNEGLVVMDRHGIVAFVNERFATMMDCTPSDLIGRAFCDFLDPAQREPMAGYFDEDAEKDDAAFESALTCTNGRVVPIRMSMRRVAAAERGTDRDLRRRHDRSAQDGRQPCVAGGRAGSAAPVVPDPRGPGSRAQARRGRSARRPRTGAQRHQVQPRAGAGRDGFAGRSRTRRRSLAASFPRSRTPSTTCATSR